MKPCLPRGALLALVCLAGGALAEEPIHVTVRPFEDVLVDHVLRAPAAVVAANESVLSAEVAGVVSEVRTDVGRSAQAGDVLVTLDDDDYRLALARAEAELASIEARIDQAELRLERARRLAESRYVSDDDLLARTTDLAVLEAEKRGQEVAIRQARRDLEKTEVRAPFAGAVVSRTAQVGAYVLPGSPLLALVQTSAPEVEAEVDPQHVEELGRADGLRLDGREGSWPLEVVAVTPVIDAQSRIQRVRLRFTGDPAPVGTSGELAWTTASGVVPVDLIVQRDGRYGLFVAEGNRARFVPLPEAQEGRPARAQLPSDAAVVIGGRDRLVDDALIEVAPAQ